MKLRSILLSIFTFLSLATSAQTIQTGAQQLEKYIPLIREKRVGFMGNQTSVVDGKHLVDLLIEQGIDLRFVFAPEHGFRGDVERGTKFDNSIDSKTGIPIYTLYKGETKAQSAIQSIDCMVFDIQDVGARFYTYIASLHRLMQLCADNNKPLIILDRPNPNGDQVDGPVRKEEKFKSDVCFHKIAMIHGLTIGELAQMINGEGWLERGVKCDIKIIPIANYSHSDRYPLPIIPSPSLTNHLAVRLYPSLCLFEGTDINVGRGTDHPFQMIGYPNSVFGEYTYTPGSKEGMSQFVENKGKMCYGIDLRGEDPNRCKFTLRYILDFYNRSKAIKGFNFFARPDFFNLLAGNSELQEQIKSGMTEEEIRNSWRSELKEYKKMREKYLLYR